MPSIKYKLYQNDIPSEFLNCGSVAIDTEAMGLRHQRDRLCLVQLCFGDDVAHLVKFSVDWDIENSKLETFNRRKLLLTSILMKEPEVLLMDEPASGLINSEIDEIDTILRMLSKEMNIAVIIVEHRLELLDTIADRVIVMDAGQIIARGKLEEIVNNPKVKEAYFEGG